MYIKVESPGSTPVDARASVKTAYAARIEDSGPVPTDRNSRLYVSILCFREKIVVRDHFSIVPRPAKCLSAIELDEAF